jgi:predicted DNA-binding transcriptional regulator AlpA
MPNCTTAYSHLYSVHMTTLRDMDHLVGPAEISRMLGVSRQRVSQLTALPDFPAPTVVLTMGSVWVTDEVREWAKNRGRQVNEDT